MKKIILLNASPRKNGNTALLLQAAQHGAQEAGAETELINLFDLKFTGCRSCMACKRVEAQRCKCYWKDDLSPLLDRIFQADGLFIGSPIYLSEPTAQFRALWERLIFCCLSYDKPLESYFTGKLPLGLIYTMNAPEAYYNQHYKARFQELADMHTLVLHGAVTTLASCETLQVPDYKRYSMGVFDEAQRKERRETVFPKELEAARQLGRQMVQENP